MKLLLRKRLTFTEKYCILVIKADTILLVNNIFRLADYIHISTSLFLHISLCFMTILYHSSLVL